MSNSQRSIPRVKRYMSLRGLLPVLLSFIGVGLLFSHAHAGTPEDYDADLCALAQRMIVNAAENAFAIEVLAGESNGFHVIQMDVDSASGTVTVATTINWVEVDGMKLPASVGCKMVNRERVNDVLGLALQGPPATCRTVNEYTYSIALAGLSEAERARFVGEGRSLEFAEDYVAASGAEWLPSRAEDYIESDAKGLRIVAPSVRVPWNAATHEFYQGTHHCKLITGAAMQYWMRSVAFTDSEQLFPGTVAACTAPTSMTSSVGSCRFWFAPAQASFCQDYSGAGWDAAAARDECGRRHASPEALAAADSKYAGLGGIYNPLSCAERGDSPAPVGTCVFHCNAADETLWHTLDRAATGPAASTMMRRACDLFVERQ